MDNKRSPNISDAFKFRRKVLNFGQKFIRNLKRPEYVVINVDHNKSTLPSLIVGGVGSPPDIGNLGGGNRLKWMDIC